MAGRRRAELPREIVPRRSTQGRGGKPTIIVSMLNDEQLGRLRRIYEILGVRPPPTTGDAA